jgi:hypothetical protein
MDNPVNAKMKRTWPSLHKDSLCEQCLPSLGGLSINQAIQTTLPTEHTSKQVMNEYHHITQIINETLTCTIMLTGSISRSTHINGHHDVDMTVLLPYEQCEFEQELAKHKYKTIPTCIVESRNKVYHALSQVYNVRKNCDDHLLKLVVDNIEYDITFTADIDPQVALSIINETGLTRGHIVFRLLTTALCKMDMTVYKEAPAQVKELIRVIKYWIKRRNWTKTKPLSFPMETLVIDVYLTRSEWTYREYFTEFLHQVIKSCKSERNASLVFGTDLKAYLFTGKGTELEQAAQDLFSELSS